MYIFFVPHKYPVVYDKAVVDEIIGVKDEDAFNNGLGTV